MTELPRIPPEDWYEIRRVGDDVTLIGRQGDEMISAEDWARRLDTIGYEIVCGISERIPRVPRRSIDN